MDRILCQDTEQWRNRSTVGDAVSDKSFVHCHRDMASTEKPGPSPAILQQESSAARQTPGSYDRSVGVKSKCRVEIWAKYFLQPEGRCQPLGCGLDHRGMRYTLTQTALC